MAFYNLGILFYKCIILVASLFNPKAKLWVKGRRNIFEKMERELPAKINPGDRVIWFHCASLGEFEQGRPVLEKLKQQNNRIVLTFFSPSGYEIRKDYEFADAVFYLPIDFRKNARRFVAIVKPAAAIFVKYEFWLNYLAELRQKQIPAYLVSGVFRPSQHFFKWYGRNFFKAIRGFKTLFVQDENSLRLLQQHGLTNAKLAGDTRFDRVMEIAGSRKEFPQIKEFAGNAKVIIAGSTWPKDEELLLRVYAQLKAAQPGLKLILVPHEVDAASIQNTVNRIRAGNFSFSKFTEGNFSEKDILVIDTIGMLSQLYQYATLAYVGGGFDNGIHNILEVMAHGVPVAFGPHHRKFVEALETAELNISKPVSNETELIAFFSQLLADDAKRKELSEKISDYMQRKTGATEKICRLLA